MCIKYTGVVSDFAPESALIAPVTENYESENCGAIRSEKIALVNDFWWHSRFVEDSAYSAGRKQRIAAQLFEYGTVPSTYTELYCTSLRIAFQGLEMQNKNMNSLSNCHNLEIVA